MSAIGINSLIIQRPSILAPITQNGPMPEIRGAKAVIFRNAGTATVNFNGGSYTLDSKETLSFNITEDDRDTSLWIEQLFLSFDTTSGAVQKLQIIVIYAQNRGAQNC